MTKGVTLFIIQVFLLLCSCNTGGRDESEIFAVDPDCVQIVMFHLEQRCESCKAVERETQLLLEEEYPEDLQNGKVKFVLLNFQSKNGKKAANLLQASGQTLYVVKGDSVSNLTSPAFMFAHTHPERYRDALRKELEKFLE